MDFTLENWPISEAKISRVTNLFGWFQPRVKLYARILFLDRVQDFQAPTKEPLYVDRSAPSIIKLLM